MIQTSPAERFTYYTENFKGASQEALDLVTSYPHRLMYEKTALGKAVSIGKLSLVPLSVYLSMGTSLSTNILGTSALCLAFVLGRMKNNKHTNALAAPLGFVLAGQKALLGAWGYAVMAGMAGAEKVTMAMLPDTPEAQPMRKKVGYGFMIAGFASISATGLFLSPWNFMPLASRLMGTIASTMINDKSYVARALHFVANTNNALYSALYSESAAATIIDGVGATNKAVTIHETDIPQKGKDGKTLSAREKLTAYFHTLSDINKESTPARTRYDYKREQPTFKNRMRKAPQPTV